MVMIYDSNLMFVLYMCGGKLSIIFRNHIAIMLHVAYDCKENINTETPSVRQFRTVYHCIAKCA